MPERSLHVRAFFGGLLLSVAVLPEALVALGIGFGLWHLFRFIERAASVTASTYPKE